MPNEPLGISFSPFGQTERPGGQGGQSGPPASTPQDAIRVLSFRPPRTVGANAPVGTAALLNGPGGAVFGPSGQNLDQLLALLYGRGRMRDGVAGLPEAPQSLNDTFAAMFGGPRLGASDGGLGLPPQTTNYNYEPPSRTPGPGFVFQRPPDEGSARIPPPPAYGGPGQPTGPPHDPLPWEGPTDQTPSREGRLI
jgi:hypothetical protein